MTLRFITTRLGTLHVREFLDTTVHHKNDILLPSTYIAPTLDIEYAEYFLCNVHGIYVSLASLSPFYTTTREEAALLRSLQEQYTPEILI